MKKLLFAILAVALLFAAGCANDHKDASVQEPPAALLDLEAERYAAQKVLDTHIKAGYVDFNVQTYLETNVCGNSAILSFLKEDASETDAKTYVDGCADNISSRLQKDYAQWQAFLAEGGSTEYGAEIDLIMEEGHDYYTYYLHRFEQDEDTCFLNPDAVEAFATGRVGEEWIVPKHLESDYGKTRYEKWDIVLVRLGGQWYIVSL